MSPRYALDSWTTCPEHGYQHRFTVNGRLYSEEGDKIGAYAEATCGCRYEQREGGRPAKAQNARHFIRYTNRRGQDIDKEYPTRGQRHAGYRWFHEQGFTVDAYDLTQRYGREDMQPVQIDWAA